MIMDVIKGLRKRKTVLLISHRLANVVEADQIYVMSQGQIKEQGTHPELLAEKGIYADLFEHQRRLEQYGQRTGNGGTEWNAEVV